MRSAHGRRAWFVRPGRAARPLPCRGARRARPRAGAWDRPGHSRAASRGARGAASGAISRRRRWRNHHAPPGCHQAPPHRYRVTFVRTPSLVLRTTRVPPRNPRRPLASGGLRGGTESGVERRVPPQRLQRVGSIPVRRWRSAHQSSTGGGSVRSAVGVAAAVSVIAPERSGRSAWSTRRAVSSFVFAFAGAWRP